MLFVFVDIVRRWASLDESMLQLNSDVIGSAVGEVVCDILSDRGNLYSTLEADNAVGEEQMFVNSQLRWSSASSWVSAGSVDLSTMLRVVDPYGEVESDDGNATIGFYVYRDFVLGFDYGDNKYSYESVSVDAAGVENLSLIAKGGYGGEVLNWY